MEELYYKIKAECELPVAMIGYTYKDFDNVIQIGSTIWVIFSEDEKNIEKMLELTTRPGFMFFNQSEEGLKWFKDNPITITWPDDDDDKINLKEWIN